MVTVSCAGSYSEIRGVIPRLARLHVQQVGERCAGFGVCARALEASSAGPSGQGAVRSATYRRKRRAWWTISCPLPCCGLVPWPRPAEPAVCSCRPSTCPARRRAPKLPTSCRRVTRPSQACEAEQWWLRFCFCFCFPTFTFGASAGRSTTSKAQLAQKRRYHSPTSFVVLISLPLPFRLSADIVVTTRAPAISAHSLIFRAHLRSAFAFHRARLASQATAAAPTRLDDPAGQDSYQDRQAEVQEADDESRATAAAAAGTSSALLPPSFIIRTTTIISINGSPAALRLPLR